MSCDPIIPRKDMPDAAAQLYRALKLKPCACGTRVVDGQRVYVQCGGCAAIDRWEAMVEVLA